MQGYKGHKGLVSGLGFRMNTHQLFSASFDKSVKIWSVDDGAYVDSLFGHQSECTAVDVLRQDRAVSAGLDRTCRVWKIPEEAQMVYRASALATDCVKCVPLTLCVPQIHRQTLSGCMTGRVLRRYVTGTEWLSGNYDGSVALWSQLKKKPVHIMRKAHHDVNTDKAPVGPGCPEADAAGWVQSVAVCPGADLAVRLLLPHLNSDCKCDCEKPCTEI